MEENRKTAAAKDPDEIAEDGEVGDEK